MKGTYEFTLTSGKTCKIEANYECQMGHRVIVNGIVDDEETPITHAGMTVYVDGKQAAYSWDPSGWRLVDRNVNGLDVKVIEAVRVCLVKTEDIERYNTWLADLIDGGTGEGVKAYEAERAEANKQAEIQSLEDQIAKAERQENIPTMEEAKKWMRQYNNVMNEGGEGYVPYIVSKEEYEWAKARLAELNA